MKNIIIDFDSSEVTGPDCVSVLVLKNCQPELLYILVELVNMCLEESFFSDCSKVSFVVPELKNVG